MADTPHPGIRIKAEVIPKGMSTTEAAKLMGVGRPALSNLLNGNASLSPDMAARLEKTFKVPLKNLMEMQARYDAAQTKLKGSPSDIKAYVPPFLAIKANDVEAWVSHNIFARSRLAVFLRTLVHSTGHGLSKVDFPGNDDAERPGWDGFVEAADGTPWVPSGRSGWEFGTNEDPKTKADGDFKKSTEAWDKKQRSQTTFVFVTPRRWPGKSAWVAAQQAKKLWKDVRAFDASDLEQWLDQSLPGQAWFANETDIPAEHVRSLDKCWDDWANVSNPPLSGSLFSSAIEVAKRTLASRLSTPGDKPILVAADSVEEALAFLSQLLSERGGDDLASHRDRVLVFDKPGVLPRLAMGAHSFIPIVHSREVEQELAPFAKSMTSILVFPRNSITAEPDIVLDPINHEVFSKSLEEMGKGRDEISYLDAASGRSLTVLRRRLSTMPRLQSPDWSKDQKTAEALVPFLLVGAWNSQNEADRLALSLLAGTRTYEELEKQCQQFTTLNDAPVWSVGTIRGVISKIDLLFAIAGAVTQSDLQRYFDIARMVLGEDDPALDLEEDKRWAASIHGKTREFSGVFRRGISETLVLLAVHGKHLFKNKLGIDPEREATLVVRDLLPTPLTTRVLAASDSDLMTYAEAAPDEFLTILERDLKSKNPAVLGLLVPVDASIFGSSPSRAGLLWALEGLAWNPATLPRAARILAELSLVDIKDNWANKPIHSLESIFRSWMPQTAANHQQRVELMKSLAVKFPEVAWKLCVAQFGNYHQTGDYSHKPRWRPDGTGFGEPFPTWGPIHAFVREMVEMALTWKDHSLETLCDLVERLQSLNEADQARVWKLVEEWAKSKASDDDKAIMREKIRVSTLSRLAALRTKKSGKATNLAEVGKAVYAALEPSNPLNRHMWLFRDGWVEESADEVEDIENVDYDKREERIKNLRITALREIWAHGGAEGILELSKRGNAAWTIGVLAPNAAPSEQALRDLLSESFRRILAGEEPAHAQKNLVAGALRALDDKKRDAVLKSLIGELSEDRPAALLVLGPFRKSTWTLVEGLADPIEAKYWAEVTPDWIRESETEMMEAVERLLKADRPRAAFSCVRLDLARLDATLLCRVLSEMAKGGNEKPGQYMLQDYQLEEAFKKLNSSPLVTVDEKAGLEFAYLEALARPWDRNNHYGIPNLERYIDAHPELFVQAIIWTYRRDDGADDPEELRVAPDLSKGMAQRGYKLLEAVARIPGYNPSGELELGRLSNWIATVRHSCSEYARGEIADVCIGKLLSGAPIGSDGVWPCEPVRDVMEEVQSEALMRGVHTGVYNSRGAHWRGEGGNQERELADKYKSWGRELETSHPFVSSKLLMVLAHTYEYEAGHEDTEAAIRRRLR